MIIDDAFRIKALSDHVNRLHKENEELRQRIYKLQQDKWSLIDACGSAELQYERMWRRWKKRHPRAMHCHWRHLPEHLEAEIVAYKVDAIL